MTPNGSARPLRLAQVAPVAAGRAVDVFDEIARLVEAARAEIDGEHHLGADRLAPFGEFVHADRVRFGRVPGEIEPRRPLLARADAVLPIVGGDEIAAGIAHDRDLEVAHEFDDVPAHAVRVGGRMTGLVDAGVDRAAEMLEEGAVEAIVDLRDRVVPMGGDRRLHVSSLPEFQYHEIRIYWSRYLRRRVKPRRRPASATLLPAANRWKNSCADATALLSRTPRDSCRNARSVSDSRI